jgi:L-amino acid N-acyltransferase
MAEHRPPLLVLVAEQGGAVVGWASLSAWSDRRAYAATAEVSEYVDRGHRGRGIGRALLSGLVAVADQRRFHTLIARVADGNAASLRLHRQEGFKRVGVMREVGLKFGRRIDVHLLQRLGRPGKMGRRRTVVAPG